MSRSSRPVPNFTHLGLDRKRTTSETTGPYAYPSSDRNAETKPTLKRWGRHRGKFATAGSWLGCVPANWWEFLGFTRPLSAVPVLDPSPLHRCLPLKGTKHFRRLLCTSTTLRKAAALKVFATVRAGAAGGLLTGKRKPPLFLAKNYPRLAFQHHFHGGKLSFDPQPKTSEMRSPNICSPPQSKKPYGSSINNDRGTNDNN